MGLAGLVGICRRQRVSICRLRRESLFPEGDAGDGRRWLRLLLAGLLAIPYGPLVICYVAVLHTVVDITCSTYCLRKYLGIDLWGYVCAGKYFLVSLLACAPALVVCRLPVSPWVSLPVGVVSAGLLYWGMLRGDIRRFAARVLISQRGNRDEDRCGCR